MLYNIHTISLLCCTAFRISLQHRGDIIKYLMLIRKLNPYSNFSLQQSCSSLAMQVCKLAESSVRQDRKFITRLQQVNANFEVTIRQTCSDLVVSSSLQTSSKKRVRMRTLDSNRGQLAYLACRLNHYTSKISMESIHGHASTQNSRSCACHLNANPHHFCRWVCS
ncbi:hypothetical protein AVEN_16205-1 [Araneus ventricosus]|uniref:Uncharacterized protein n=1 Tax=Araneus ventricosus TaxID=182803 RepID=A0A4Y2J5T9_ARAVE|nr:hypothetical protein AVEN_16205-1 [Araneus ventricosus]